MFFFSRPAPLGTPRAYFWNQALSKGINASKTADGQKHQALPFSQIIQGVRLERSESYCLLLLKYENYGLFNPTGGSPDVVHLIK